jgi:two-component system response regulator AtoC
MLLRVLVVSGSGSTDRRLRRILQRQNLLVDASNELWSGFSGESYDVVVVALSALPDPKEQTIETLGKLPDRPEVIVVQDGEDALTRARLLSVGCLAVLNLDLADSVLSTAFSALISRRSEAIARNFDRTGADGYRLDDFAAVSPAMQQLLDLARRVARADSSLLILGETGVGKEWLARAIHGEGARANGPFIAVNCAAVPESMIESELFGHEKGAFTGSVRTRRGQFELSHGGTLFLDEVADLPVHLQAKLLRVLEDRKIRRLGAERTIALDVRIMAATNCDLDLALKEGRFREDLYFRLGVVTLVVPPLRERPGDIEPLAHSYLERFAYQLARPGLVFRDEVLTAMQDYRWPGNVRELINVIERAVLLSRDSQITLDDLPQALVGSSATLPAPLHPTVPVQPDFHGDSLSKPLKEVRRAAISAVEADYLRQQLAQCHGRVGEAARRAGLDPRSLYAKMRRYGLRKEDFRPVNGRRQDG